MTAGDSAFDLELLVERLSAADTLRRLPGIVDITTVAPPNPPKKIQTNFVGLAYEDAYNQAGSFVRVADEWLTQHGGSGLASTARVLDFGSGWGRISRMLLAYLEPTSLYAVDVDPHMTALVNTTLPGINALTVDPLPPSVLGDRTFDAAVAYSVFSHLAPQVHEAWAAELARVLAPGGMAFITVIDKVFFELLRSAKQRVAEGPAQKFETALAGLLDDVDAAEAEFDAGEPVYVATGGGGLRTGDYYGWAAMPSSYIEKVWGAAGFDIVEWVPSGVLFDQAMVGLVRRDDAAAADAAAPSGPT